MAETMGRQDAAAESGTEERAGGMGQPKAHPTAAAAAAAVGGPVTAGPTPTKEERDGGAVNPTAQTIGAAPAALAGCTVRVGPAPANKTTQREEGWDETPRRARKETDHADRETEERVPPRTVARA